MEHQATLPLFVHPPQQAIARRADGVVSAQTFLGHVLQLANELPQRQYSINLCEDRYHFLVAFSAILLKAQTNLLPPSHSAKTIQDIAAHYPDSYCLLDHDFADLNLPQHRFSVQDAAAVETPVETPHIGCDHIACIPFTSGSTGTPTPNPKTWGRLLTVTRLIQQAFGVRNDRPLTIVATVPPQHMYGLETSVLLPLVSGACVYAGRPFYPDDVRQTLTDIPGPKILITTPIHLRACVQSGLTFPTVEFIISATAPLSVELAAQAERTFNSKVLEIYGCTEFGSLANRRTVEGDHWRLFDGLWLSEDTHSDDFFVNADFLPEPVALSDQIEIHPDRRFRLLGRKSDMINIAGKRASMADLNLKLLAIPGVIDGVIFYPEDKTDSVSRVVAFVVAPELTARQILQELKQYFDAAFLPRPLYLVPELPREKSGKLPRRNILALWNQLTHSTQPAEHTARQ